jgi:hypothetical protein
MVDAESVPSAGLVAETQVIPEIEPGRGDLIGPLDIFKILPVEPVASSDRLGWVGLEAVRYQAIGTRHRSACTKSSVCGISLPVLQNTGRTSSGNTPPWAPRTCLSK